MENEEGNCMEKQEHIEIEKNGSEKKTKKKGKEKKKKTTTRELTVL